MTDRPRITAGVHLPQAGPAASGEALRQAAVLAEQVGFQDVWLSDHLVVPTNAEYPPSAYVLEPLASMAWVAAATTTVRIGTTVLVLPMRNPVVVAKSLATIDQLSGGRVVLGTAAGWLEAEFDALGVPFAERGARTDEALEMIRVLWTEDHITRDFPVHGSRFVSMRAKPQPVGHLPIWIGGHADIAVRRAIRVGDGWHGAFLDPTRTARIVLALRAARPEPEFTVSMRTRWDPLEDDPDVILAELDAYREAGVDHVVPEPRQRNLVDYLRSIEALAELLQLSATPTGAAG
jgi:probable F420-dependent oxidoreductase